MLLISTQLLATIFIFLFDGFECAEDLRIPVEPDDETFAQVARDILDRHKEAFKKLGE